MELNHEFSKEETHMARKHVKGVPYSQPSGNVYYNCFEISCHPSQNSHHIGYKGDRCEHGCDRPFAHC